jgi:chromate transporter
MQDTRMPSMPLTPSCREIPLREAAGVWAKIGLLSFGGPAGQIALMHRELVEKRRWISDARFLHALNYCMLLPGPEAAQLAIYIGWLLHRTVGGLIAGLLFVLPGFLVILALSIAYVRLGDLPALQGLFFGLKAAVLAVVVHAVLRIGRRALRGALLVTIAAAAFVALRLFDIPFPVVVVGAGLAGLFGRRWLPGGAAVPTEQATDKPEDYLADRLLAAGGLAHTRPSAARAARVAATWLLVWWLPVLAVVAALGAGSVLARQGVFFSQAAVVSFGGAYAVLAYIAQRAVEDFAWIAPGEMLDGLALAETTPGPLIMVVQFVAFLGAFRHETGLAPMAAGIGGSLLVTWVTFAPCFLWIFLGGTWIEALRGNSTLQAALSAITAAVVGVILNLSVWFALHVVFAEVEVLRLGPLRLDLPVWATIDWAALVLAAAALVAMLRLRVGMGWTLAGAALAGIAWVLWLQPITFP